MTIRASIRTGRTLWRIYRHRRRGHVLVVDPGAVTCQTCSRGSAHLRDPINGGDQQCG